MYSHESDALFELYGKITGGSLIQDKKGILFDIKRYAVHDGPGIRTTVFLKGCPLQCGWCHNPEGINSDIETVMKRNTLEGKVFREQQTIGYSMTVNEVMLEIEKDILFFDESEGGVTFSGGEPLMQPEFLGALIAECKARNINTALDTSGYAHPDIFYNIIPNADLVLLDLKMINDENHKKITGVSNQTILENLESLIRASKKVLIRFPVIPELTDSKDNVHDIQQTMNTYRLHEIDLLPYHRIANHKYERLRLRNKMSDMKIPEHQHLLNIKNAFEDAGFHVRIGG